jgi:hypothetical protein
MKRIINTLMLSLFLLACPTVHAGLNQTVKNAMHYTLKKVGDNPGWLAYAAMIYSMYRYTLQDDDDEAELEEKTKTFGETLIKALPLGAAAIAFSAACNWWASRL